MSTTLCLVTLTAVLFAWLLIVYNLTSNAASQLVKERRRADLAERSSQQHWDALLEARGKLTALEEELQSPTGIDALVKRIEEWGEARSIPVSSNAYAQALTVQRNLDELKKELVGRDWVDGPWISEDVELAIGDVFVSLTMVCACERTHLSRCVRQTYLG